MQKSIKCIFICQIIWNIGLLLILIISQYTMIHFLYAYILLMLGIMSLLKHSISQSINSIKTNQDLLIEKERLASLGQMIGGIAHNLKTPIFSITGGLEGLSDLINEYDISIDDINVTPNDHHAIAKDMNEWIEKLKKHVSYMSDVITTIKSQTLDTSNTQDIDFSLEELFNHVLILMQHELKKNLAVLNIENNVSSNIKIKGNISSLVQVLDNLISNAIEAYNVSNKEKIINLTANYRDNNIIISVQDFGTGISKDVQDKLFKEMITTKGKYGTGLGLFISHATVKAQFKGNLTFKTGPSGTIFIISIPTTSNQNIF